MAQAAACCSYSHTACSLSCFHVAACCLVPAFRLPSNLPLALQPSLPPAPCPCPCPCLQDADVYILDDPLSAVDVHVGRHIFDRFIQGAAAGTTRLLVTNQLQYTQHADRVVVLEDGNMVAQVRGRVGDWVGREREAADSLLAVFARNHSSVQLERASAHCCSSSAHPGPCLPVSTPLPALAAGHV
jgi:hypothetical protein